MVLLSGIVLALRRLILYFVKNPYVILPTQLLHGFTFIVVLFALPFYINRHIEPELKATGQALKGMMIAGFSRILGAMLGGYLSEIVGIRTMFLVCALYVFAMVLLFTVIFFKKLLPR